MPITPGIIQTVLGNGQEGFDDDGGPALQTACETPYMCAFDPQGNMFVCMGQHHRIRRMDARTGLITLVAGTGDSGYSGLAARRWRPPGAHPRPCVATSRTTLLWWTARTMPCAASTLAPASLPRLPAATPVTMATVVPLPPPVWLDRTAAAWTPLAISTLPTPTTTACAWWGYRSRGVGYSYAGQARVRHAPQTARSHGDSLDAEGQLLWLRLSCFLDWAEPRLCLGNVLWCNHYDVWKACEVFNVLFPLLYKGQEVEDVVDLL